MKNITLLTGLLLTITTCSNAQVLFGDTYLGGTGNGVLFNYNTVTGRDSVDFAFNNTDGASPNYLSGVMQATDGMLYGTASSGGSAIHGVMYRFNPVTGKDTVLINFDGPKYGSAPYGSLIQCTDGLLYGMTNAGGASGDGVLYSYDPVTLKDSIRLTFNNTVSRGGYPYGPLLQAKDGYIYGMNSGGGIGGSGVLFRFDPKTNNDTILYAFPSSTSGPRGGLIQGTDGLLYGLTIHGGSSDDGTIFSYDPVKFKDSVRLSLD
ncbi:MAG TPA: choice-of-anchor tandem repeat GloVer-containing protein, partial [Bacteroidia bacterium]|nr:choice-of-anchor tandem repeat GloVer-containing protein [Bacteroidia bacterium]